MTNQPLISVIIPVYNCEKYVAEALASVFDQTYKNIEVICVNDGSTDGSLAILQSFGDKITIIDYKKNCGIATARNKGLEATHGEFIAFLDSDDIWIKGKLEKQIEEFEKDPELDASFTHIKCFISPELPDAIKQLRYCPPEPQVGQFPGTLLIKKTFVDHLGLFNTELRLGEFIDWFARAQSMNIKYKIMPDIFHLRRIHTTNIGVYERDKRHDYLKVVKAALERKRNADK